MMWPKYFSRPFTRICTFVGQDNILIPSGYPGQRLEYLGQIQIGRLMGARTTLSEKHSQAMKFSSEQG